MKEGRRKIRKEAGRKEWEGRKGQRKEDFKCSLPASHKGTHCESQQEVTISLIFCLPMFIYAYICFDKEISLK